MLISLIAILLTSYSLSYCSHFASMPFTNALTWSNLSDYSLNPKRSRKVSHS